MKKILLIATGGTIASTTGKSGLSPTIPAEELLKYVPEIGEFCKTDCVQPFNIDSTNVTPAHWLTLSDLICGDYAKYDGFVICHGTDTMAYTAAALSYLIQNSKKPVVLTGAQKPIDKEDTDARVNLRDAFAYAASEKAAQITIAFHGKIIAGTRAKKIRTKSFNAFESVDFPVLGTVREGKVLQYIDPPESVKNAEQPRFFHRLDGKVGLCCLTPGFSAEVLDAYFQNNDAVVLSGYGTGGIPDGENYGLYEVIERWKGKGKTLVVTTQVQSEGSDMNIYRVGRDFKERFSILESFDMTWESVITKLMWILSVTRDEAETERLFYTPVNYDLIR
ncbi:MAG: asparaginase [Candidatus Scatosoma sp.]